VATGLIGASMAVHAAQTGTQGPAVRPPPPNLERRFNPTPMKELEASAQRLRDAVQDMAQQPPGARRNDAIQAANEALREVKDAMVNLPRNGRAAGGPAVGGTSANIGSGSVASHDYSKSMKQLLEAAQRLRDAIHVMASLPAGNARSGAIHEADKALLDTQDAMASLPPDMRTAS
jgi:hypothetical protein